MTTPADKARIAELEEDNGRLRRLLDQRDAPAELRHRLRGTLALLRQVIRRSAVGGRDLDRYVAHLEDRVEAVARAQAAADQHGEIGLHQFLADELFHYGASEGERVLLSGPDVRFQPRAGQAFALALHELAVNAVEHGAVGAPAGSLDIAWSVDDAGENQALIFTWQENGASSMQGKERDGFGTEVLTRMLAYELNAETTLEFETGGLRCTIRFPLPKQIGRVVA